MIIRAETPADHRDIGEVVRLAFDNDAEPKLVEDVRASDAYVPELSLVAEIDGAVVGHVMLSYVGLGPHRVLQLAPLAVRPDRQNAGIGDALTTAALDLADRRGEPLVLVLGHRTYYPRFGFEPAAPLGIEPPDPAFGDAWMVKRLRADDERYRGRVVFPPALAGA